MPTGLSLDDIVNTQIDIGALAVAVDDFGSLLIAGDSDVIDTNERVRYYAGGFGQIAQDFGVTAPEFLAAAVFFGQIPTPKSCYIGRAALTATSGRIKGGVLSAQQQLVSGFNAVTSGGFTVLVDGAVVAVTGQNLSGALNLNQVASILTTALGTATMTWTGQQFQIESNSTGPNSSVSPAAQPPSGTDLSAMLNLTAGLADNPVIGIAAESPIAAAQALANVSNAWYGLTFATATAITDAQHLAVAAFIEGSNPRRMYGITTQSPQVLDPTQSGDLASVLAASNYSKTSIQYSSSSPYAIASYLGRAFTVDFTANNSVITLDLKAEPGIAPENLTESNAQALVAKNCNSLVQYQGVAAGVIQPGVVCSGRFFDEVHGLDWLQNTCQVDLVNFLLTSSTKVPQTDPGVQSLATVFRTSLAKGVNNGLIAPGQWNGPAIGAIVTGQQLTSGFYVYAPPIASQTQDARDARVAPTLQAAIKLAGAIQSANTIITVNR